MANAFLKNKSACFVCAFAVFLFGVCELFVVEGHACSECCFVVAFLCFPFCFFDWVLEFGCCLLYCLSEVFVSLCFFGCEWFCSFGWCFCCVGVSVHLLEDDLSVFSGESFCDGVVDYLCHVCFVFKG